MASGTTSTVDSSINEIAMGIDMKGVYDLSLGCSLGLFTS